MRKLELRDHWMGGHLEVVTLWLGAERGSEVDHARLLLWLCLVDGAGLCLFLLITA